MLPQVANVAADDAWLVVLGDRPSTRVAVSCIGEAAPHLGRLWLVGAPDSGLECAIEGALTVLFAGQLHTPAPTGEHAEHVLRLYRDEGESALAGLSGRFLVIAWNGTREELIAQTDPLGHFPLFYARASRALGISTSPDVLLRELRLPTDIDRAGAAGWVLWSLPEARRTLFVAVERVPPGHRLTVERHGSRLGRYWQPVPLKPARDGHRDAVFERFDRALVAATHRCLDLGQPGILLSGGVDSATVAAVTVECARARAMPEPLALSLCYRDPDSDESEVQTALAAALGIEHVVLRFEEAAGPEGHLLETLTLSARHPSPAPVVGTAAFLRLASEGRRRGCEVLLTGQGTEWLQAAWACAADLLPRLELGELYLLCKSERAYYGRSWPEVLRILVWRNGVKTLLRDGMQRLVSRDAVAGWRARRIRNALPAWIAPDADVREQLVVDLVTSALRATLGQRYTSARRALQDHPDVAVYMEACHHQSQQLGAWLLHPYMDADLIRLVLNVPPRMLWTGGHTKALARESLRRRLPTLDAARLRSATYDRVLESLVATEGGRALELLGGLRVLDRLGIVDRKPVEDALRLGDFARGVGYSQAWQALALEAWLQARLER
jgi:asparagine synthase (glutamine-hydrolysing)